MPKKQQIKLSPLRSGRRVRWTFEVSAGVDGQTRARAKTPTKKRKRSRPMAKVASSSSLAHVEAVTSPTTTTAAPAAVPVVATQPSVESTPTGAAAAVLPPTPPSRRTRQRMVLMAGVAVLVIATVAMPRQRPASDVAPPQQPLEHRVSTADANPSPTVPAPAPHIAAVAAPPVVKTRALTEAPKKASVRNATDRTAELTQPIPPAPVAANYPVATATESTTKPPVPELMPAAPTSASGASPSPVTITGCLEISTDGNEFRLADTDGADAPKSRNWRTGFLRKRTAPVALVGAADPLALKKSVGKRIAATGLLTDRELHVSSFRVVRSSCN